MKKAIILVLAICFLGTLFTSTPASADRFWPGVAAGVGSAILLGTLIHAAERDYHHPRGYYYPPRGNYHHPRNYYHPNHPIRVYNPPSYVYSPPPAPREYWVPGHWVERYGPYGEYQRTWASGYWVRD